MAEIKEAVRKAKAAAGAVAHKMQGVAPPAPGELPHLEMVPQAVVDDVPASIVPSRYQRQQQASS